MSPGVKSTLVVISLSLGATGLWWFSRDSGDSVDSSGAQGAQADAESVRLRAAAIAGEKLYVRSPHEPQLNDVEVFRWGLFSQRPRLLGVYGRPIPTSAILSRPVSDAHLTQESSLPLAHLMYRGETTTRVYWLKEAWLESSDQPLEVEESFIGSPSGLPDLKSSLIAVERRVRVTPDPLTEEEGERVLERRVYRSASPYQLVALLVERSRGAEVRRSAYWGQEWSEQVAPRRPQATPEAQPRSQTQSQTSGSTPQPALADQTRSTKRHAERAPRESLLSARLLTAHLSPSEHYHIWRYEEGRDQVYEVKLIERRFERRLGLWREVAEVTLTHLESGRRETLIISGDDEVIAWRLTPSLRGVISRARDIEARESLPRSGAPLERDHLPPKRAISPQFIQRALAPLSAQLNSCLSSRSPKRRVTREARERAPANDLLTQRSPLSVEVRLTQGADGRVRSAQVTGGPRSLNRCVGQALESIKLSAPPKPTDAALLGASLNISLNLPLPTPKP